MESGGSVSLPFLLPGLALLLRDRDRREYRLVFVAAASLVLRTTATYIVLLPSVFAFALCIFVPNDNTLQARRESADGLSPG